VPEAQRQVPLHLQIASHYKALILNGEPGFMDGGQMPSVRLIAREWKVSVQTAQRAVEHLRTERLVRSEQGGGTFIDTRRAKMGPQQRMRAAGYPFSERVVVRAAEIIPAPEYIIPILGLEPASDGTTRVIRREQVTHELDGSPYMLSVTWYHPQDTGAVPELMSLLPLPYDGARLLADRTNRPLTFGRSGREARGVLSDGREGPTLRLPRDGHVLAEVWVWAAGEEVLEYGEAAIREGKVIESDMEP
jgi:GntR family transcriptional regulator